MTRRTHLLPICLALIFLALAGPGCARSNFTVADMVIELDVPDGFAWTSTPVTIDDSADLTAKLGQDSADLLSHNWLSSTCGQLSSRRAAIRIIVHQLVSKGDTAELLAEHSYPDAQQLDLGQEALRWIDRALAETIFFRRDAYLVQLTLSNRSDASVLRLTADRLDKALARRFPFF